MALNDTFTIQEINLDNKSFSCDINPKELETYYSNELEHKCSKGVSLMALNDTFTIQEINLDKKDLSLDNKLKKIEAYWNNECTKHPSNNHCKIFCD